MLSEIFFTLVITSGVGLLLTIAKLFFKSRCKEVNICCMKCIRDVDSEEKAMEFEYTHRNINNENKENV